MTKMQRYRSCQKNFRLSGLILSMLVSLVVASSNGHDSAVVTAPLSPSTDETATPSQPGIQVPLMKPDHVALSLRLTCELNRKLSQGSRQRRPALVMNPQSHQIPFGLHEAMEPVTVFHANESDEKQSLFCEDRWGPPLQDFAQQLLDNFELSTEESSVVLSLTMIYLDRVASVETPRSNGIPPCPFCSYRTVHRLILSATLTAARVATGKPMQFSEEELLDWGISPREFSEMMVWMESALGDLGHFVSMEEMQSFKNRWESAFLEGEPTAPLDVQQESESSVPDHDSSHQVTSGFLESENNEAYDDAQSSSPTNASTQTSGFQPLPVFTTARVHAA